METEEEPLTHQRRTAVLLLLIAGCLIGACGKQSDRRAAPPIAPAPTQATQHVQKNQLGPNEDTEDPAAQRFFDPRKNPDAAVGAPLDPHTLTTTQLQYGIAPKRDPHVTYAPDVILMEDGDKAIRMCASDGITWAFDANAPHVNEFQEGKIVFATGRAVGRIGQLQRNGDTVIVRLAPVEITEVVKEGHFIVDGKFHPQDMIVYVAPDFPSTLDLNAAASRPTALWDSGVDRPRLLRTAFVPTAAAASGGAASAAVPAPPAAIGKAPTLNLDNDGLKIYPVAGSDTSVGVEFDYDKNGTHLKSSGRLRLGDASVKFELNIVHGSIEKFGMDLSGVAAMELEFESSAAQDRFINASLIGDPYVDMTIPMPVGGLPLSLNVSTKFIFKTGFSARTSTLLANAKYSVKGDLFIGKEEGFVGIKPKATLTADGDLGRTADGVSVGISSMNLTFRIQPMVGIGAFGFTTGVFVGISFGGDVVKQSSIASPCREGFMRVNVDSGVGYKLSGPFIDFVNTILKSFTRYRLDKEGVLIPGPNADLMKQKTEIPDTCATPRQS